MIVTQWPHCLSDRFEWTVTELEWTVTTLALADPS